ANAKKADSEKAEFIGDTRNKTMIKETVNEKDETIDDFYAKHDKYAVDAIDTKDYEDFKAKLSDDELALLNSVKQFYEIHFSNIGGIPMPLILEFIFEDSSTQVIRIPDEIWRRSEE